MQYEIGKELHKLNTRVCRILEKNCPEDDMPYLTGADGRIICYLWEHQNEEIYQKDLEKEFGINRSTASREVGLMEKKGLLIRRSVPRDGRLKQVMLTEHSRMIAQHIYKVGHTIDEQLLNGFSDEEKGILFSYLKRMRENIE